MSQQEIRTILAKYNQGLASAEESKLLENWYVAESAKQQLDPEDLDYTAIQRKMWTEINGRTAVKTVPLWRRFAVASAMVMVVGFGIYFYAYRNIAPTDTVVFDKDIAPGINKAILTLASGQQINLSDANSGELAKQQGIQIIKMSDGQIRYRLLELDGAKKGDFNTIEIPRGAQQVIELPDGSKVWLNSESSIKFPTTFVGLKRRDVQLKGEAYFEVAKDKAHPFVVKTANQEVEVLGTHFNINSYGDENEVKTTLLEGSVMVTLYPENKALYSKVMIKPNQEAVSDDIGLSVHEADVEQATDWKNGDFVFNKESLGKLMRRVSRWYNVEVAFTKDVDLNQTFSGKVSRKKHISEVLRALQSTGGLKFSIKDRKVTVSKK